MYATIDDVLRTKSNRMIQVDRRASVEEAASELSLSGAHSLLVMDGGRLLGVLSVYDIVERVVAARLDPAETEVREVMRQADAVVERRTSVRQALALMQDTGRRHLPVLEGKELFGVVSHSDLTRVMLRGVEQQVEGLSSCLAGAAE